MTEEDEEGTSLRNASNAAGCMVALAGLPESQEQGTLGLDRAIAVARERLALLATLAAENVSK